MSLRTFARKTGSTNGKTHHASAGLGLSNSEEVEQLEVDRAADSVVSGRRAPAWSFAQTGINASQYVPAGQNQHSGQQGIPLLRKAAASEPAHADSAAVQHGLHSPARPLDADTRTAMESRFNHDFSQVRVHTDAGAAASARSANALAYTVGSDVVFGADQYAPHSESGRRLLAHELTHVVQYGRGLMGRPERTLEDQADRAEHGHSAFARAASPGASYTPRLLKHPGGGRCTGIELTLPDSIVLYGTEGPISATVALAAHADLPPGSYNVTYDANARELKVDVAGGQLLQVSGTVTGTKRQIAEVQKKWQDYLDSLVDSPVTLTVQGKGAAGQGTAGRGTGAHGEGVGKRTKGPGGSPQDPGTVAGKVGGKPGGTGTGENKPAQQTGGGSQGTAPVPAQGSGSVVVQITDPKQIDELKRRGLLDGQTADDIKDKADKHEPLTFDELIALFDALSQTMVVRAPSDQKSQENKDSHKKDSWIDIAQFIKENRDKFSGQQATGADGMSLDEMKAILAKYHQFVGVKDAPKPGEPRTPEQRVEKFDPEKRASWNTLDPWEKDIWKRYTAKYGNPSEDSSLSDLHLTPDRKLSMALHMSPNFMREGAREAAHALFNDPLFIAGIMVSITLYFAAWLAPEPLFSKAFAAGVTILMLSYFGFSEIKNVAVAWMRLKDESEAATTFDQIEEAAENFGKSIGGVGLRVLVMLATILASKALPTPEPPPEGGGMQPATAGGPPIEGTEGGPSGTGEGPTGTTGGRPPGGGAGAANGIKVLPDGTVIILGPGAGAISQSVQAPGGGGGGRVRPGGGTGGSGGGAGVKGGEPGKDPSEQQVAVKEDTPPEETQGIKSPSVYGPDIEQQQGVGSQVGNFAHKYFERLVEFIKNKAVISEKVPANVEKEYPVKNPAYTDPRTRPRIDRLDRAGKTVIEFKPNGLYDQGLAEAKAYAQEMDKYEPLPGGEKWDAKCITYDFDMVLQYLEDIGYLTKEEVAAFRARNPGAGAPKTPPATK